jgi:hypothetical protein
MHSRKTRRRTIFYRGIETFEPVEGPPMQQTSLPRAAYADAPYNRQAFHKPHTSLSTTGHFLNTIGILSPLVIGEFVKDPERKWRFTRIAVIATAALSEGLYTHRIHRERLEREQQRERSAQR